jgi:hypothetical protein
VKKGFDIVLEICGVGVRGRVDAGEVEEGGRGEGGRQFT